MRWFARKVYNCMPDWVGELIKPPAHLCLDALFAMRSVTAQMRCLPDFIGIGAQKAGSTSLFRYLIRHPQILPSVWKEVHYFDFNFPKGPNWYRSFFPTTLEKALRTKLHRQPVLTGECSPYYIAHPDVPRRVHRDVPAVKLLAVLRNPVDRAFSHWRHESRKGREPLTFARAIKREEERLAGECAKLREDVGYYSYNHHRFSYLSRGDYIEQIQRWMEYFPRESLLIVKSEDLFTETPAQMERVFDFLGLSPAPASNMSYPAYNKAPERPMPEDMARKLEEYFKPYNERLYEFLGQDLGWERQNGS